MGSSGVQPAPHLLPDLPLDPCLIEGFRHAAKPGLRSPGGDGKREVTGTHPGTSVQLAVQRGTSEELGEKASLFFHDGSDGVPFRKDRGQQGSFCTRDRKTPRFG